MKLTFKALMPLLAVAALSAACNPFANDYSHVSGLQDPRFAPFTYTSDRETKVQTRIDSFNERWPGMQATNGNVVGDPPCPRAGSRVLVDWSCQCPHHDN